MERVAPLRGKRYADMRRRRAVVVGCGALGCAVAVHLVRSGVGHVRIIDRDIVEQRNLVDQIVFAEADATNRRPKAEAAARTLGALSPHSVVEGVVADCVSDNAVRLTANADIMIDGADNLETKMLINDVAVFTGTPLIYGGCAGTQGVVLTVRPKRSHCLRCLWPAAGRGGIATLSCQSHGVLPGTIAATAAMQFTEATKILMGMEDELLAGLVRIDVWQGTIRQVPMPAFRAGARACPACEQHELAYLDGREGTRASKLCGDDTVLLSTFAGIDLERLARRHQSSVLHVDSECVHFEAESCRLLVFASGRTLVHGAGDTARARSLYARYVLG